jgi:hypothetical protein
MDGLKILKKLTPGEGEALTTGAEFLDYLA